MSMCMPDSFIFCYLFDCSNSLDKIFYPLFSELAKSNLPPCNRLVEESQIECLRRLLFFELQSSKQPRSFIEMLSKELESLVEEFNKNLFVLESKVLILLSYSILTLWAHCWFSFLSFDALQVVLFTNYCPRVKSLKHSIFFKLLLVQI